MTTRPCLIGALLALTTGGAFAACEGGAKTLFSCNTKAGRTIEVCDRGATIGYAFGRPKAAPDIALNVPRAQASTFQWDGMGRYENYAVNVPNGSTTYRVFWSRDKNAARQTIEAGVNVLIDGKDAATVLCTPASVVNQLVGVDLRKE